MDPDTVMLTDGSSVVLMHFLAGERIACMPNMLPKYMSANKGRLSPHCRTDSAAGVTCPMCKVTEVWRSACGCQ